MSATNLTKNLKLPQFVASDKPSWLGDFNGAMKNIDDGVGVIKGDITKASDTASSAKSQSDANTVTLGNVNTELQNQGNRITALEAGGGTEQLEQRVNTLSSDVESLQTRANTFEEEIAQNGTTITNLTKSVNDLTPRVKNCEDGVTRLDLTTESLQTLVADNDKTYKTRFTSVEGVATQAFNQSQTNKSAIEGINNRLSLFSEISVATLVAVFTSSVYTVSDITAIYDATTSTIYIPSISFYGNGTTIAPSGTNMCTFDVGFILGFSDKQIISDTHQIRVGSNVLNLTFEKALNSTLLTAKLTAAGSFSMPSIAPITFNGCQLTLFS